MQRTCFLETINSQISEYHGKRKVLGNISLMLALMGIVLMVAEIEMVSYNHYQDQDVSEGISMSLIIKMAVSVSTVSLLLVLIMYHRVTMLLSMLENGVNQWRLVFTYKWLAMVLTEILICSIHPIPLPESYYVVTITTNDSGSPDQEKIPVDVILTIVMFLRFYLILRVMVLHSYIYNNTFQRELDAVQRRNINTQFAIKYIITVYSRSFLICTLIFVFLFTSWSVRVCEMYEKGTYLNYFRNVWFIGVTFLTIGYGDIVPLTICGRFVAIMAGTFGVVCTAYVVAIIADIMQLTYPEVILHRFVIKNELDNEMKQSAAAVVQNVWKIKKARTSEDLRHKHKYILEHKMKLLRHVRNLKVLQNEKIQLEKKSLTISTIFCGQRQIYDDLERLQSKITRLEALTSNIEVSLDCGLLNL